MYDDVFVEPLKRVIEAYQPVATTHPDKSWMDMLNDNVLSVNPIMECDGLVELVANGILMLLQSQRAVSG